MAQSGLDQSDLDLVDPAVHARRWWVLAVLCLSMSVIVMDNTILNVAIPSMIRELHASNSDVQWIIDSYTIVFAGLLLTTGSLSDRFGRKGALQVGLGLFATGSVLSALANSPVQLIATRAFMGFGGALIMPSTLSLLTNTFRDPRERGRAIGIWAAFSSVGVALGPIVGGLLLRHFSWSSVFWVNLPLGVLAIVAGAILLPTSRESKNLRRLDPVGALLSIVGLSSLVFGVIELPSKGWSDTKVISGFAIGVLTTLGFILWELHSSHPMLDMNFFRNPRFTAANIAITLHFFAMFGSLFLMAQYWQFVHGYTPLEVGVRLIPYAAAIMIVATLSARVVERLGSKRVITLGLVVVAGAMLGLSFISPDTPYLLVILPYLLMATGVGLAMPPATESIMGSLPRDKAGVGSAVNDTTRQMGGAIGVAVIGSIVASVYTARVTSIAGGLGVSGVELSKARSSLGGALEVAATLGARADDFALAVKEAFVEGLSDGLRISSAIVLMAAVVVWRFLPARAADHVDDVDPDAVALAADASTEITAAAVAG